MRPMIQQLYQQEYGTIMSAMIEAPIGSLGIPKSEGPTRAAVARLGAAWAVKCGVASTLDSQCTSNKGLMASTRWYLG